MAVPDYLVLLLAPVVAMIVVGNDRLWRVSRTVVTIAHEGGHALVAVLTGRRLTGIRLHSDTSGVTVSVGRRTGPGMVCTALAGYLAPSLVGLASAGMVSVGWTEQLLWAAIAALLVTLVYVRNWYGLLAVLVTGAAVGLVAWYGSVGLRFGFAAAAAWFLLFGGLRAVRELWRARGRQLRRGRERVDSDADQLAQLTRLPAGLWIALFTLVAAAAVLAGGWLLIGEQLLDLTAR